MGLIVKTLKEIPVVEVSDERSLYVYLLDYGWPDGDYENIFRNNWEKLSNRAEETGAIVVRSTKGVHFANEVLSWHHICGHEASDILPAILITKCPPSYFEMGAIENSHLMTSAALTGDSSQSIGEIALLPLKQICQSPDNFLTIISSIFDDLDKGLTLKNFRAKEFDVLNRDIKQIDSIKDRVGRAFILQPNFAGIGIDIKKLIGADR